MENNRSDAETFTRDTAHNFTMLHEGRTSFKIFVLCFYIATFAVGLIGNGLVVLLTGCRMKTTVNSIWFLNLATADLIFILSSIIGLPSLLSQERTDTILIVMLTLNQFASVYFLVVISLDRCLCTWMAVWAQNKRTLLRARIICVIVWVSSICCSIPYFNFNIFTYRSMITFEFIMGFLIPFLIIVTSYIAIGVRIKRFKRGKQLKSYRVIITVILFFFTCWFPYHVMIFCVNSLNNCSATHQVIEIAGRVSIYLTFLNSCLNPILYVFMCDEYKKKLKQSLLLVLETAFAEDHLDFKADAKGRTGHENQTELLDM